MSQIQHYLGIDVGHKRVGLAQANSAAKIPSAVKILENNEEVFGKIAEIAQKNQVSQIVVGLPRNMSGEETAQSSVSKLFANKLSQSTDLPIVYADESLSSVRAKDGSAYKSTSGKYFDDAAACYILEEFLRFK